MDPTESETRWNQDTGESYGFADYTAEELLEQAQSNAQATIMATAIFLHRKGISLDEWAESMGPPSRSPGTTPRPGKPENSSIRC